MITDDVSLQDVIQFLAMIWSNVGKLRITSQSSQWPAGIQTGHLLNTSQVWKCCAKNSITFQEPPLPDFVAEASISVFSLQPCDPLPFHALHESVSATDCPVHANRSVSFSLSQALLPVRRSKQGPFDCSCWVQHLDTRLPFFKQEMNIAYWTLESYTRRKWIYFLKVHP
jgi:hypothetical protein